MPGPNLDVPRDLFVEKKGLNDNEEGEVFVMQSFLTVLLSNSVSQVDGGGPMGVLAYLPPTTTFSIHKASCV